MAPRTRTRRTMMAIVIMPECEGEELALGNGKLGRTGGHGVLGNEK